MSSLGIHLSSDQAEENNKLCLEIWMKTLNILEEAKHLIPNLDKNKAHATPKINAIETEPSFPSKKFYLVNLKLEYIDENKKYMLCKVTSDPYEFVDLSLLSAYRKLFQKLKSLIQLNYNFSTTIHMS